MVETRKLPGGAVGRDEDPVEAATAWFVRMRSDLVTARDRHDFEAWLARDSGHRRAYAQAAALWEDLGEMPDPRRGAAAAATSPERRDVAPAVPRRRLAARLSGGIAACVALSAVAVWWAEGGYDGLRADHATGVGETRSVKLPDGSVAELNTDTALAVRFSPERRRIALYRGEAFFTVAADPGRPFEVAAEAGVSTAIGTGFDVREDAGLVTVTVEHGRVMVAAAGPPAVTLGPGETVRYGPGGAVEKGGVDPAAVTAWRRGRLVFANWTLREVVAEIDRFRPGRIVFVDSRLADARFTGVVSLGDTDRALDAIAASLAVEVLRVTPYLTLLRSRS